jgi:hypothetical protein
VVGVGQRFVNLGLNAAVDTKIPIIVECLIDDSFKANSLVFKEIRRRIVAQDKVRHLALNVKCQIHLCNLIRKTLVLSTPGYWSSVVRLGHLFEVARFRRLFSLAMNGVIEANFCYIPVFALPSQASMWNCQARSKLNLWSDDPGSKPSKRYLELMSLLANILDNMTQRVS